MKVGDSSAPAAGGAASQSATAGAPSTGVVALRTTGYILLEFVVYAAVLLALVVITASYVNMVPFPGITTTPETSVINKVGLSLQSLKYVIFESELSQLYAPSPPPPPAR